MKVLPIYTPGNAYYFADSKFNLAEPEQLTPTAQVYTAPLRFNVLAPLTDLAREGVPQDLIGSTWGIDPTNARLHAVAFKLWGVDKVIGSVIGLNVDEARFKPTSQQDFKEMAIAECRIPFVFGANEVRTWLGEDIYGTIWEEIVLRDMYVRVELVLSATTNIETGKTRVQCLAPVRVGAVMDSKGRKLDTEQHGVLRQIEEYCVNLEPIAYWIDADWLEMKNTPTLPFEMVDPNSAGRGLALLAKGVLAAYDCVGYAADVTEATESTYATTELYLEPMEGKPKWKVVIEEGLDLQEGWVNIEFFGQPGELLKLRSLGRFEKIPQVYVGNWAGAIGMFLVNGNSHRVNLDLPAFLPEHTTWAEIEKNPDEFATKLHWVRKFLPAE